MKSSLFSIGGMLVLIGALVMFFNCGDEFTGQSRSRAMVGENPIATTPPMPEASCEGHCGKKSLGGCWCDNNCEKYNDCCKDKKEVCDNNTPTPTPPHPKSCVGYCGKKSSENCWCDDFCEQYGDCCPDKKQVCDIQPTPTPNPTEQCKDHKDCSGVICNKLFRAQRCIDGQCIAAPCTKSGSCFTKEDCQIRFCGNGTLAEDCVEPTKVCLMPPGPCGGPEEPTMPDSCTNNTDCPPTICGKEAVQSSCKNQKCELMDCPPCVTDQDCKDLHCPSGKIVSEICENGQCKSPASSACD